MEELADVLGTERLVLELLVYRLVSLRHLLVAGEGRFLGWAADEVEHAVRSVRQCELTRAVSLSSYADRNGLSDEVLDLDALLERAGEPWHTMLADHADALRALVAEIDAESAAIRRLARVTSREAAERVHGDAFNAMTADRS